MILFASFLLLLGGVTAIYGQKLFRLILPFAGLVVGVMIGFSGTQAVLGTGAVSLAIALMMAVLCGIIVGLLSFAFYHVAVTVLVAILGASAFTYLGVAIGLEDNGFVLTLLGLAGLVLGLVIASRGTISISLVFTLTAFLGVALMLAGVFLFVGEVTLDQLHDEGIIRSVLATVDQSFLWFFVWLAGSVIAMNVQIRLAQQEFMTKAFEFIEEK